MKQWSIGQFGKGGTEMAGWRKVSVVTISSQRQSQDPLHNTDELETAEETLQFNEAKLMMTLQNNWRSFTGYEGLSHALLVH
ncbi:hypothetical protein Baya_10920 [Bagarius yarrelli]|uniref:Uncharacterized protein n=1 Tax=Bagarius yarrelli TaxID=175774 RepID=A0A556V0V4_BAGYA|nr:hypothetical protein Baya_10920 [Bagarius yarrelli]